MLTLVWTMLTTGSYYDEPGPDYYTGRTPNGPRTTPSDS